MNQIHLPWEGSMTGAKVIKFCLEEGCKGEAHFKGYCRRHYLKNWKAIRMQEQLKAEDRLNDYIEKLVDKYPDDYLRVIKEDLASDKDLSEILSKHGDEVPTDEDMYDDEETRDVLEELKKNIK